MSLINQRMKMPECGLFCEEPTPKETEPMDYQDYNEAEADAEGGYDDVPTKDIRIGAMSLTVRLPFKEGHVCTAAEARALNQTRLENIRNTATAKAKAASEKNLDLLETLEEIGIRARRDFIAQGGEELLLVTSLNATPRWLDGLAELVRKTAPQAAPTGS